MKKYLLLLLPFLYVTAFAQAPFVDISTPGSSGAYIQDFNTLVNTGSAPWVNATLTGYTLAGWQATSSNLVNIVSNAGASNSGSLYSYGTGITTDRALGSVASGTSNTITYGMVLRNNTGLTVTSVQISYVGEQWRSANAAVQKLNFGYKTGTALAAGGLTTGFTANISFDFSSPNLLNTLAVDGNLATNRTTISNTLAISLAPNDEIFIRWQDLNDAGNDQGLGIDSLVVIFNAPVSVTAPSVTVNPASAITETSALLNGNVNANGGSTTVTFNYGLTASYGLTATAAQSPVSGAVGTAVSATVSSLSPNTLYHYSISAVNSAATTNGSDSVFYTLANVPGIPAISNATDSSLDITINAGGNPAGTEFALSDSISGQYVQASGAMGTLPVWQTEAAWSTLTIAGLAANTVYTYYAKARNTNNIETAFGNTATGQTLNNCTPYSIPNPQTICDGGSYSFNGHTYTIAGSYNDTLQTVDGCDSIIVTMLTVNPVFTTNNPQTICNGSTYSFNGHSYTTTGNYNDTLISVTGCDSIIVTQLTVNPSYLINNPQALCTGSSYFINGHTYNTAGTYYDSLQTLNGCDSIIATQITLTTSFTYNNPQFVCDGNSYTINGHTYSIAGTYNDTLLAVSGCDSIIATQLTVNPIYTISNAQSVCPGNAYILNGHTYTVAGIYNDTLLSVSGCDSIIITTLTVNPTYSTSNPQTICQGNAYSFNSHTYTVAGSYNDTLVSVTGCDSIIVTMLTVNPKPAATAIAGSATTFCSGGDVTINANTGTGLSYQWYNGNSIISLAINNSYMATTSGDYRVLVTDSNACSDTSAAVPVTVNSKPATSAITGNLAPEINSTEVYNVVNTSGSAYNWMITNGTQLTGTNTNNISIQWSNMTGNAEIKLVETGANGCLGDTVSQSINIMLPVNLISFTATLNTDNTTGLQWSTAQEINNSHFEVERSLDGKDFIVLGTVKGNGTYNGVLNYSYIDMKPANNQVNYYRLKQIDFNGQSAYSDIVSVSLNRSSVSKVSVYPNPLNAQSRLEYTLEQNAPVSVVLYNSTGQPLSVFVNDYQDKGTYTIAIPEITTQGIYFIRITSDNISQIIRVVQ